MIYEKLLQATGKATLSTAAQVAGAFTNIILDPILIFGYLGFPAMGVAGAAYATVIGQFLTLFLGMFFHHKLNRDVDGSYGIYYKIQQFIFFAAFGLNNTMIPIISFNYGMRDKSRVKDGIKFGMMYTVGIMTVGAIGFQIFAVPLVGVFSLSPRNRNVVY